MRPPHQSTTLSYANMSKMRPPYNSLHTTGVHYINHYTFSIQTCQNCVTLALYTCPPYQSIHFFIPTVHHMISLHFSYTKVSKMRHTFFIPNVHYINPYTFFYTKVSKMRHTFFITTVHYINHYTFPIQKCQKCVHHMISLHFCYTKVSKMRLLYDTTLSNAYLPHSQVSIWCLCISN